MFFFGNDFHSTIEFHFPFQAYKKATVQKYSSSNIAQINKGNCQMKKISDVNIWRGCPWWSGRQ
jgi:hypothetical protein